MLHQDASTTFAGDLTAFFQTTGDGEGQGLFDSLDRLRGREGRARPAPSCAVALPLRAIPTWTRPTFLKDFWPRFNAAFAVEAREAKRAFTRLLPRMKAELPDIPPEGDHGWQRQP